MISLSVLSVILLAIVLKILPWIIETYKVNKALSKVHGPTGHWFYGQSKLLPFNQEGLNLSVKRMVEKFPKFQRIIWINPIMQTLSLYWPSALKTIYNSSCPKNEIWYDKFLKPWLGNSLLISRDKEWYRIRKLLTPAFHYEILNNYVETFNECAEVLIKNMEDNPSVALFSNVSLMTLDVILQTAMSSKTNCQTSKNKDEYIGIVYRLSDLMTTRFVNPLYLIDFIYFRSVQGKEFLRLIDKAHARTNAIIKQRRNELKDKSTLDEVMKHRRHDFLDILLLAKDENGVAMTDKEIGSQVETFTFAGHDTAASAISWILYNFARNQKHQDLCRKEVQKVLEERKYIKAKDLPKLKYLTMCIKESMRLHPPVPMISRQVAKDQLTFDQDFGEEQLNVSRRCPYSNSSQTFPAGTSIDIHIYCLHRNPKVWENPEKFDPNRFTEREIAKRSPFAYTPFSAGQRNCIGQTFAMMEIKIAVAKILNAFIVEPDETYPKPRLTADFVLRSENDIHVTMIPVN